MLRYVGPGDTLCSPNPGFGIINYDNFLSAMFNVLVVTTNANWTDQMFWMWDATSGWVTVYYVSVIAVCGFFAVNIFLVGACGSTVPFCLRSM